MSNIIAHDNAIFVDKGDKTLDKVLDDIAEAINGLKDKEDQEDLPEIEDPYSFPKPLPIRFLANNTFIFDKFREEELVQAEAIKRAREGLPIICYNESYPILSSPKWTVISIEPSSGKFVVTILMGENKYTCTLTDPNYEEPML